MSAALVCAKLLIPIGHVGAGLRSFGRTMPEEVNRLITDQVADLLFTLPMDGNENLVREGVAPEKIHLAGNVMIDTPVRLLPQALLRWPIQCLGAILPASSTVEMGEKEFVLKHYGLVTLHCPSNVNSPTLLTRIMAALSNISRDLPLIFPIHPRICQQLEGLQFDIGDSQWERTYWLVAIWTVFNLRLGKS